MKKFSHGQSSGSIEDYLLKFVTSFLLKLNHDSYDKSILDTKDFRYLENRRSNHHVQNSVAYQQNFTDH